MRNTDWAFTAVLLFLIAPWQLKGWGTSGSRPCDTTVGMLVTDFTFRTPVLDLPRVEVRQCGAEQCRLIQIVAWTLGTRTPALVIDTGDFGVVQAVARANVFVVETGGATRDQVFAIIYEAGKPRLALKRTTRGTAVVTVRSTSMEVEVSGIYAGDAPPRIERQQFKLDLDELRPR